MPILKFSVTARVGGSGNFDLNIKGGTLPDGTRPGDHVTADTQGIESFTLKENIFDGIPKIVVGSTVKARMIMGATQEVDVKGRFNRSYAHAG